MAANAGMIVDRTSQPRDAKNLPDLTLVSADNHIELTEDIFYQRFPARLRDKAPRVWFDRYWRVGFRDDMQAYPDTADIDTALARSVLNDGFEFGLRNQHLEAEGIDKEIVYPQSLMAFIRYPDQDMQELMYRTYNEHMAELGKKNPGRFYGVGICSNWWNPDRAECAIQQIVDLGLKSFLIPFNPGKDASGNVIDYDSPNMDRFWACAAEANLPINFHIGEVPSSGGRGGFGTFFIVQAAPFRRVFGSLIFGGIFDRHPKLQVVFAEGGINWIAGALQDAELTYGAHRELFDWPMEHRPSHYWFNNMYATFQTDTVGLRLLDHLGADRVMWGQDYPHSEGTFGYTATAIDEIIDLASHADARKILSENAINLYKLSD
ncbi:amidohydrolase [Mycolicibacterium sp. P1-5]|nr:amidohydrolase [Mycolicibacterium sp. P1-5]